MVIWLDDSSSLKLEGSCTPLLGGGEVGWESSFFFSRLLTRDGPLMRILDLEVIEAEGVGGVVMMCCDSGSAAKFWEDGSARSNLGLEV